MYLCFHWLQLSRRSMGVINTLQQLTFNILPQPLTPLMADWLCEAWEPRGWEWHGSMLSVCQRKVGLLLLQNLWLQLIPYRYEVTPTREGWSRDPGIFFCLQSVCFSHATTATIIHSSLFLSLPTWAFCLHFTLISATAPNTLPSAPAVLRNLISSDVFSEQEGTAFHFNQIQAFQKNP